MQGRNSKPSELHLPRRIKNLQVDSEGGFEIAIAVGGCDLVPPGLGLTCFVNGDHVLLDGHVAAPAGQVGNFPGVVDLGRVAHGLQADVPALADHHDLLRQLVLAEVRFDWKTNGKSIYKTVGQDL